MSKQPVGRRSQSSRPNVIVCKTIELREAEVNAVIQDELLKTDTRNHMSAVRGESPHSVALRRSVRSDLPAATTCWRSSSIYKKDGVKRPPRRTWLRMIRSPEHRPNGSERPEVGLAYVGNRT
jgi:hypothetical protein